VGAGRHLSGPEVRALLVAASKGAAGVRDLAMIGAMYGAGLRRAEVARLALSDVDPTRQRLRVHGKGSKERWVYLPTGAVFALDRWLAHRGETAGGLFVPLWKGGDVRHWGHLTPKAVARRVTRAAGLAGLADVSTHDLRRTFAGDALDAGTDLATVQRAMGHASPATTAVYDRRGERTARAAADRLTVPLPDGDQIDLWT
jgi:integrase